MSKKYLVHIVAVDENNGIGYKDGLLFRIKKDLQQFKRLTMGHVCIAGSKTYDHLPPLKGREMVRLTRKCKEYREDYAEENRVIGSVKEYLDGKHWNESGPAYVIGGGEVYAATLQDVSVIVMTRIHATAENCDTFYPDFLTERKPLYCTESSRHVDEDSGVSYSFVIYGYDREHLRDFLTRKAKVEKDERQKAESAMARKT